jgi:Fe-S cluster assembly iron-binding protein IscA
MLAITEDAATAIDGLLTANEMPAEAGVRITAEASRPAKDGAEGPEVRMELAKVPEDGDQVIDGASVFVEPEAALLLQEKVLDADLSAEGVQFTLREKA